MKKKYYFLALILSAVFAHNSFAEKGNEVVAKVNGYEITKAEVDFAEKSLYSQLTTVPEESRYPIIVQYLVERHLLAQTAAKEKIEETKEFQQMMSFLKSKALRDAYFALKIETTVTEKDAKEVYEKEKQSLAAEVEEVRASHILVETEKEANNVIIQIGKGTNFKDLAKKYSKDEGSKVSGGDLGFFERGRMVKPFSDVAFSLKAGEVSKPVKTNFGWHIIKVVEKRNRKRQFNDFEDLKPGLMQILLRKKVHEKVLDLKKNAKIEFIDPRLQKLSPTADGNKGGK